MKFTYESRERANKVAQEAFWLAYQASVPVGLGFLHERGGEPREAVLNGIFSQPQYGTGVHADYVYGRMVKLSIHLEGNTITVGDDAPRSDYQSWCRTYPTNEALIRAAEAATAEQPAEELTANVL